MNTLSATALLSGKRFCGTILLCLLTTMASHAQTFTTIASFNLTNGNAPSAPLIQGPDGNFYGTTSGGGNNSRCGSALGCGTVFQVTPAGIITTLYSFCSHTNCTDGSALYTGLALGLNGNFYGTTYGGGASNHGTVFEVTPRGKLTTLHSFCAQTGCPDGSGPLSGLTLGHDGNFYGTTAGGGSGNRGIAYKISPTGNFTVLYTFCTHGGLCAFIPQGPLALASNGKFYGTTIDGGTYDGGVIFQLTESGVVTVVHSFSSPADQFNVSNGVMQAADGNLYGAADEGGSNSGGYVFQLTPAGQFTDLYNFCSQTGCSDGVYPQSQLIQGTDGNLYGTTSGAGGGFPYDTVFQVTTTGNLTTLYSFCSQNVNCPDGVFPQAGLLQATNGTFYGTTLAGGTSSPSCPYSIACGTVFSLSMGLAPFVQPYPAFGKTGHMVGILGNSLTGTTEVTFNGSPAQFTVVSDTLIKATVPTGATTGSIQVTTPNGTLVSNVAFLVE